MVVAKKVIVNMNHVKKCGDCYVPFTEEEKAINKKLLTKYFSTSSEKTVYINDMIKNGEIDKTEA